MGRVLISNQSFQVVAAKGETAALQVGRTANVVVGTQLKLVHAAKAVEVVARREAEDM